MKTQVTERENIFNKHDTKEVHTCLTERVFTIKGKERDPIRE